MVFVSVAAFFGVHRQVWEVDETMCGVDDHNVVSHEVQSYDWPCQILHYDGMLRRVLSPMSNLSVAVDIGFSNWPFATWI